MESRSNQGIKLAFKKGYTINSIGECLNPKQKKINGKADNNGYIRTRIKLDDGRLGDVYFHKLQAFQKFGSRALEDDVQVRHLNGNPRDNSIDNIVIGSASENMMDKDSTVRKQAASTAAKVQRKLSLEEASELRNLRNSGWKYSELMNRFGITKSTISFIINNKTYQDDNG